MIDKCTIKNSDGNLVPMIPEIYSHIISNPEFQKKDNSRDTVMINLNDIGETTPGYEHTDSINQYMSADNEITLL